MVLYHRTNHPEVVLASGFEDRGDFLTRSLLPEGGVWLSDQPLHDAYGETVLSIEIPASVVAEFEQPMKSKGVREFLLPAEIVNRYGPAQVVDEDAR
jgi:hypothetical protein